MKLVVCVLVLMLSQNSFSKYENKCPGQAPDHTWQDVMNVTYWAAGKAFANYAEKAGYTFDMQAYMEDSPHWALFNFGRATATACLTVDVLGVYLQTEYALSVYYHKSIAEGEPPAFLNTEFKNEFLRLAEDRGFDVYLTPAGVML